MLKKIKSDLLKARKEGDKQKASVLRTLVGEFDRQESRNITDADVVSVLIKFKKGLGEVLKYGSEVAKSEASMELDIINAYLPKEATNEDLENLLSETNPSNPGEWNKALSEFQSKTGLSVDKAKAFKLFSTRK